MNTQIVFLILILVAFVLFLAYQAVIIKLFGIPESLSNSYYLLESKHKGFGWFFTLFMWTEAMLLIAPWIVLTENFGPWESHFTFLAPTTCFGMIFVGTAPKFKQFEEGKVHVISAVITSIAAMLWDVIPCWKIAYVLATACLVPILIATFTKTWGKSKVYWLEMMAFFGTYIVIIVAESIQMLLMQ